LSAPGKRPAQWVFLSDDANNLYEPLGKGAAGAALAARLDGDAGVHDRRLQRPR
jgi:hypothetical protein